MWCTGEEPTDTNRTTRTPYTHYRRAVNTSTGTSKPLNVASIARHTSSRSAAVTSGRRNRSYNTWTLSFTLQTRFVLACLQGALAAARSKAHAVFTAAWFALHSNSRSVTATAVTPSYCRSMRVYGLRGTPGDLDVNRRV